MMRFSPTALAPLTALMLLSCARGGFEAAEQTLLEYGDDDSSGCNQPMVNCPYLEISNLSVLWTAEKTIRWSWDVAGDGEAFSSYRLLINQDPNIEPAQDSAAEIWDKTTSVELGYHRAPNANEDLINSTLSGPHSAGTTYYGQLEFTDINGEIYLSNVAMATTLSLNRELVIFSESSPSGYRNPESFQSSTDAPYSGTYHYQWLVDCPDAEVECWENLRYDDLNIDVLIAAPALSGAVVEFWLQNTGETAYWSEVRLSFVTPLGIRRRFSQQSWVTHSGGYRMYQFPLSSFRGEGLSIGVDELSGTFEEFGVGASFERGETIRVDEVRLRWNEPN